MSQPKPSKATPAKESKDSKTYALKLGKSFDKSRPEVSYHTMRFDFKPVSLGSSKDLTMQIGGENGLQVTATMAATVPPKQANGSTAQNGQTVYKGSKKPYTTKECVLIVDEVTGEVTLEKLGDNVMLKKARPEGGSKNNGTRGPQSDFSPSVTPSYSPTASASPVPSPLTPTSAQNTPKKPAEKPAPEKKTVPPAKAVFPSKPSQPTPPPKPVLNGGKGGAVTKDSMDSIMESSSSSSSSESSSSSSSSSSGSDSDSDNEDSKNTDDIFKDSPPKKSAVPPAKSSAAPNRPSSASSKPQSTAPLPAAPPKTVADVTKDLDISSDSDDDADGLTF